MAFETNVLTGAETLADIFGLIDNFATANGWTVHNSTSTYLRLEQGDCHVSLAATTTATVDDKNGPSGSNAAPDHRIEARLSVPGDGGVAEATIRASALRAVSNDWTPPYANYWLFSGDGVDDPPYIHLVVQKSNGRFCHLSFGVYDKKGAVYDGGAFVHGVYFHWWFANAAFPSSGFSREGSDASSSDHWFVGSAVNQSGFATYNVYLGDVDSDAVIHNNGNTAITNGRMTGLFENGGGVIGYDSGLSSSSARWFGHVFFLGPNPINGVSPLFEIPAMRFYSPNGRSQYLGSVPGVSYCSMIGRNEGEEVSFATDDYMIFPVKRFLPWKPEPWAARVVTSGPYGFAFKKVV
jgi:hypothetical protein